MLAFSSITILVVGSPAAPPINTERPPIQESTVVATVIVLLAVPEVAFFQKSVVFLSEDITSSVQVFPPVSSSVQVYFAVAEV
ncbi:MAG: hypothetical protein A2868_01870 [Candidatus Levybacteria bacterium RIFCSPHIGHO2_01_FULL_40_15b]|nr:MAG: hypothetical protein A2868_01870 [Candidatus Levybacteria bacterium RIFCSPHIGHO2_01_FULL_40_15b]